MSQDNIPPRIFIFCNSRREALTWLGANGRGEYEPIYITNANNLLGYKIYDSDKVVHLNSYWSRGDTVDIEVAKISADCRTTAKTKPTHKVMIDDEYIDVLTWDIQGSSEFPAYPDDVPEGISMDSKMIINVVMMDKEIRTYMADHIKYGIGILSLISAKRVESKA